MGEWFIYATGIMSHLKSKKKSKVEKKDTAIDVDIAREGTEGPIQRNTYTTRIIYVGNI